MTPCWTIEAIWIENLGGPNVDALLTIVQQFAALTKFQLSIVLPQLKIVKKFHSN